jgi:hypothetical protein
VLAAFDRQVLAAGSQQREAVSSRTAALVSGRVWFLPEGALDPFIEAATGLGQVLRTATFQAREQAPAALHERGLVPLVSAKLGADLHLTEHARIGGVLSATHWLESPHEQCPAVFGVCSFPAEGTFELRRVLWSAEVSLSFAFGQRR